MRRKDHQSFVGSAWLRAASLAALVSVGAWADISGTVYLDLPADKDQHNTYGVHDSNEPGIAGITVKAFDSDGNELNSVITDANGHYSITTGVGDYRIEFQVPDYLEESPDAGAKNARVRFVHDNGSGVTVDLGLHDPNDYSSTAKPDYVTNIYVNGSGYNDKFDLVSNRYDDQGLNQDYQNYNGDQGTGPRPTVLLKQRDIGAVWGIAVQPELHRVYMATVLKRHFGFAGGNPSRIWYTDYNASDPSSALHYFDLQGVNGIDLGSVDRTGNNALDDDPSQPNHDDDAYAKVGKMAYGDLEYDAKSHTLWAVNLYQRALIRIDTTGIDPADDTVDSSKVQQYLLDDLGAPSCPNGTLRPWALTIHNGKGYVGAVCDALQSGDYHNLKAYVLSFDLHNPTTLTQEVEYDLDYDRSQDKSDPEDPHWYAWTDQNVEGQSSGYWDHHNQPILSDVEFDENDTMYLAFFDRYGFQIGMNNYSYPNSTNTNEHSLGNGEMRKVCLVNGSYKVEGTDPTCPHNTFHEPTGDDDSSDFFNDMSGDGDANPDGGAYALLKGSRQLLRIINDPHPEDDSGRPYWNTNGVETFDLDTGHNVNWYSHLYSGDREFTGKAIGMGDIEFLTDPAPVEIGNRVWFDRNGNGIQDAGEPGISGVEVKLYDESGQTLIASATTDSDGYYIFSGADGSDSDARKYNLPLQPDTAYTIKIENADGNGQQSALQGYKPTADNQGNDDQLDSDGAVNGNDVVAAVTAADLPNAGADNHSFDFGFKPAGVAIGNLLFIDDGTGGGTADNGVMDSGEDPVPAGVKVELYKSDNTFVGDTTTDPNGRYYFDNLEPGDYYVEIPASEFGAGKPLEGYRSSTGNSSDQDNADNHDHGIDDAHPESNGIKSIIYTLSVGGEPTGEDHTGYNGATADDSANFTDDFGFVPGVAIGSTVWLDANNNGILDAGEQGISGVHVQLFHSGDDPTTATPVAEMDTDANGNYYFDNLAPGSYFVYIPTPPANAPASSTDISTTNGDNQTDGDDNGLQSGGMGQPVRSPDIDLQVGQEPLGGEESYQGGDRDDNLDASGDMTVDFGFWNPQPAIDLEKHTNGQDADAADGSDAPRVHLGDTIHWEYIVTNTGSDALVNISVTDNPAESINCPQTTLAVGESMTCTATGTANALGLYENNATVTGDGNVSGTTVTDSDPSHYIVPAVAVGSLIWDDADNDGVQDAGEQGIAGAEVTLLDAQGNPAVDPATGNPYPSVTTGANGKYCFCDLPEGNYSVQVKMPAGYIPAANQNANADDNGVNDSNIAQSDNANHTYTSGVVELTDGNEPTNENSNIAGSDDPSDCNCTLPDTNTNATVDFGFHAVFDLALIKTYDGNGTLRPGDSVTFDINVTNQGTVDATDITVNDYIPSGMSLNDADWTLNGTTASRDIGTLAAGATKTVTITLKIDEDFQGDSLTNNAEIGSASNNLGLADVDSTPGNDAGTPPDTANDDSMTQGNDDYDPETIPVTQTFDLALVKTYTGDPVPPGSDITFQITVINQGTLDANNVTVSDYLPAGLTLNDPNWTDEGNGRVSRTINSIPKDGNATLEITLHIDAGFSDANFTNLAEISEAHNALNLPDVDSTPDTNPNNDVIGGDNVIDNSNGDEDDHDPVTVPMMAAIGDYVWMDDNMNGLQDDNHPLSGVHVVLHDADGNVVAETDTNASGGYFFGNLPAGDYYVSFDDRYSYTLQDQGNDDAVDSDVDRNTFRTETTHLDWGERDMTWDAGITPTAHIGDYFWIDENHNGIQDPGESPVVGALVELFDANGDPVTDIHGNHSVTTDANGRYGFDVQPGQTYQVRFHIPDSLAEEGYVFTTSDSGNDDADSDADGNGYTATVTPFAGQNIITLDAGVDCGCDRNQASNDSGGGSALGVLGGMMMMFLSALMGLWMIRREEARIK